MSGSNSSSSSTSESARKHAACADDDRELGDAKRQKPDDVADPVSTALLRIASLEARLARNDHALAQVRQALACTAIRAIIVMVDDGADHDWPTWFCEETQELAKEFDAIWGKVRNVLCDDTKEVANLAPLLYSQTPKTDTDTCDFGWPYGLADRKTACCKWPADRAERMAAIRARIDAGKKVHVPTLRRRDYRTDQFPDTNTPYLLWHVYLSMYE